MRKSNDIISSLTLKRMCYILLRTWTEWWLNIGRHIKLTPSPQHLKQEKGKSRESEKRKLTAFENRRKRGCLIFRSVGEVLLAEDFELDIFGIPQLEAVDCETLHLFTSKTDKACLRATFAWQIASLTGGQEIVWDFRTCGWMNLQLSYRTVTNYKWFFRDKLCI